MSNTFVDQLLSLSTDGALWRFNESSGTSIADSKGSNTLTASGLTLGATGLVPSDSGSTSASSDGTGSAAAADDTHFNYEYTQPFSVSTVVNTTYSRPTTDTVDQPIISKLLNSGTFAGWEVGLRWNHGVGGVQTANRNLPNFILISADGTEVLIVSADQDLATGTTYFLTVTYDGSGTFAGVRWYVNGQIVPSVVTDAGPITSTILNNAVPTAFMRSGATSGFVGSIGPIRIVERVLTKDEVMKLHWEFTGTPFAPETSIRVPLKPVDQNGDPVRINNAGVDYDSSTGKYWFFGLDTSIADTGSDQQNKKVLAYWTRDLIRFNYAGVALDATSVSGLWSLSRCKAIYCASTGKWVMWGHASYDSTYNSNQWALVAESDTPDGPYTILNSSLDPDGFGFKDCNLFRDDDGTAYAIYTKAGQAGIVVSQLASNYRTTSGSNIVAIATSGREAPAILKHGSTYFLLHSQSNFYNAQSSFDVQYATATSMLGTWTGQGDPFSADPVGTRYNSQPATIFAVQGRGGPLIYDGDFWRATVLDSSPNVWIVPTFPTDSTLALSATGNDPLDFSTLGTATNPSAATGLTVTYSAGGASLAWANPDAVNDVSVQRADDGAFTSNGFEYFVPDGDSTFTDSQAVADQTYYYRVVRYSAAGRATTAGVAYTHSAPSVLTADAGSDQTITGATAILDGSASGGTSPYAYAWEATTKPAGASEITATGATPTITFDMAGDYVLTLTVTDNDGTTDTDTVAITVSQTVTSLVVSPASASVAVSGTRQFAATVLDQFGDAIAGETITWTNSGSGSVNSSGLYTAPAATGSDVVTATDGAVSDDADVTVVVAPSGVAGRGHQSRKRRWYAFN